jgi:hypothetical protein
MNSAANTQTIAAPPSAPVAPSRASQLALALLETELPDAVVAAYVAHHRAASSAACAPTPAQLRAVFAATHPDFRETAADLRDCRVGADRTRLGDLSALECEVLTAALTTPRWEVKHYAAPGVKVARFVEYSKAADFARTRTLYGKPCAVKPISEAA